MQSMLILVFYFDAIGQSMLQYFKYAPIRQSMLQYFKYAHPMSCMLILYLTSILF